MKNSIVIISLFLLGACNSKDEQFCKCMKAGEDLNEFSESLFNGEMTAEKAQKMKDLKAVQSKECIDYQTMKGPEMLKKKAECK